MASVILLLCKLPPAAFNNNDNNHINDNHINYHYYHSFSSILLDPLFQTNEIPEPNISRPKCSNKFFPNQIRSLNTPGCGGERQSELAASASRKMDRNIVKLQRLQEELGPFEWMLISDSDVILILQYDGKIQMITSGHGVLFMNE